jgi:hypothetical protein
VLVGALRSIGKRIGALLDGVDKRIDKPAKDRGIYTSGSEQMVDSDMAREAGRAVQNKRSGFGRRI